MSTPSLPPCQASCLGPSGGQCSRSVLQERSWAPDFLQALQALELGVGGRPSDRDWLSTVWGQEDTQGMFLGSSFCCLAHSFSSLPSCPTALLPPHSSLLKWEVASPCSVFCPLPDYGFSPHPLVDPTQCPPGPFPQAGQPGGLRGGRPRLEVARPTVSPSLAAGGGSLPRWGSHLGSPCLGVRCSQGTCWLGL